MSRIISPIHINYEAKNIAFSYQTEAFLALRDLDYSAIFHEQGLGKTKIAIDLMLYWLDVRDIDTVLIVTKKQLVNNWVEELNYHTHIKPKILSSNKRDNFYVLNSPARVVISNFETLSTDKDRVKLFLKARNVAIIIDESTKIKNPEAKLTKDFFELAPLFKIRTIMTGTPVANRPYDIWAQIYFLDHGASLGDDFEAFKKETDLSNKLGTDNDARRLFESRVGSIYEKIASFSVRETKSTCSVDLPNKVYKDIYATFSPKQAEMYRRILYELQIEVNTAGTLVIDDERVALKRLLRLNQVASNPALIDDSYDEVSGKEIVLEGLLQEIVNNNEKCIVWSNYIENIDFFYKHFSEYAPRKVHGSMSIDERNRSIEIFKKEDRCKILFATPQAAKEGLTLTIANHVIFYDRGFNLDDYLQAQDRIHRISQKKTCYVYNIMVKGSIDDWIDRLLNAKQNAALLAQGDIGIEDYSKIADYSYGELIKEILIAEGEI